MLSFQSKGFHMNLSEVREGLIWFYMCISDEINCTCEWNIMIFVSWGMHMAAVYVSGQRLPWVCVGRPSKGCWEWWSFKITHLAFNNPLRNGCFSIIASPEFQCCRAWAYFRDNQVWWGSRKLWNLQTQTTHIHYEIRHRICHTLLATEERC